MAHLTLRPIGRIDANAPEAKRALRIQRAMDRLSQKKMSQRQTKRYLQLSAEYYRLLSILVDRGEAQ